MTIFWLALSLYTVPAVFFGARTIVKTLQALRRDPLSVRAEGLSKSAARWIVYVGVVGGVAFAALRYSLFWPWDVVRRLRGIQRTTEPPFRGTFVVGEPEPQQRCEYTVQEGDDLQELLDGSGVSLREITELNLGGLVDGTVAWIPGNRVVLPRAACLYLCGRFPFGPPKHRVH